MAEFMVWKLVIDLGFLGAVVFFCLKFAKLSTLSQVESVMELEGSLRRLMQEAQASGAQLSEVLVKRQGAIEKLMLDMQAIEQRIKRLATAAELQSSAVKPEVEQVKPMAVIPEMTQVTAPAKMPEETRAASQFSNANKAVEVIVNEVERPAIIPENQAKGKAQNKQYNIFGEEIVSTPAAPARPLVHKVEKEVVVQELSSQTPKQRYESQENPANEIQRIYSAAEELLKAGKEVEYVAFRTKLPVADVQMLATMLEREQSVPDLPPEPLVEATTADPRLGVLGSIKRQVQTL